jgi:hypothetical protein
MNSITTHSVTYIRKKTEYNYLSRENTFEYPGIEQIGVTFTLCGSGLG